MKRNILFFLLAVLTALTAQAQELTIKSMTVAGNDISASHYERKDLNGQACALVKVLMTEEIDRIEGNVIGAVSRRGTETWVYLSEGTQEMRIIPKQHVPLMVRFADYGIKSVKGKTVYELTVITSQSLETVRPAEGMGKLRIDYTPAGSDLYLYGKLIGKTPLVTEDLKPGEYSLRITATGFENKTLTVNVSSNAITNVNGFLRRVDENGKLLTTQESEKQAEKELERTIKDMWTRKDSHALARKLVEARNGDTIAFRVKDVPFYMTKVDSGQVTMKYSRETKTTDVPSFFISQTEVTQELWMKVMESNPSLQKGQKKPVYGITWDDAQNFVHWLNDQLSETGVKFSLPTDVQWVYAAQGGNLAKAKTDNHWTTIGWLYENSIDQKALKPYQHEIDSINQAARQGEGGFLAKALKQSEANGKIEDIIFQHCDIVRNVAMLQPNKLGLYDMIGGAQEWCLNTYDKTNEKLKDVCYGGNWMTHVKDVHIDSPKYSTNKTYAGLRLVINDIGQYEKDAKKEILYENIKDGMKKYGLGEQ